MRKFLIGLLLTAVLASCSTPDPLAQYRGKSADTLFNNAKQSLIKGDYSNAASQLEALNALYPFGDHAEMAQLDLTYAYYKDSDFDEADVAADRYIHLYPQSNHVDYAMYLRALTNFHRGLSWSQRLAGINPGERDPQYLKQAYLDLRAMVAIYPHSAYRADAVNRMAYVRNLLAARVLSIADYYFARRAFVGAVNRANEVIFHFQGAPSVIPALKLAIKTYRILKMPKMAEKYQVMLQASYPSKAN